MLNDIDNDQYRILKAADECLLTGTMPQASRLASVLGESEADVAAALDHWWAGLPERVTLDNQQTTIPDIPDSLSQAFQRIWQHAVQEAQAGFSYTRHQDDAGVEAERRISDEALKQSQGLYQDLESRFRDQTQKLEDAREYARTLEAEIAVLKNNIAGQTNAYKREEQLRIDAQTELEQLRKQAESQRRVFEQRIKDEQQKVTEASGKAEVEVRHYRSMLDKVRDEAGKRESVMTREIHELQGQVARKDVKIDTLASQISSLDEELAGYKQDAQMQHRESTKVSSALLSETNKNKRLEDRVIELNEEIRRNNQRAMTAAADATRRENALRNQLKERDEAVFKAQVKMNALEKRLTAQDDEIRRLSSRV